MYSLIPLTESYMCLCMYDYEVYMKDIWYSSNIRHLPVVDPLHWLFLVPGVFLPKIFTRLSPSPLLSLFLWHLHKTHLATLFKIPICFPDTKQIVSLIPLYPALLLFFTQLTCISSTYNEFHYVYDKDKI